MNATAAIAQALLNGDVLTIKNSFELFGISNAPREISRQIEAKFGVSVSRTPKTGVTRYGVPCSFYEYRLNRTEHNLPGIQKMQEYVREHSAPKKTNFGPNQVQIQNFISENL